MAVFLNESQAGCDRQQIAFPHLLLCMGVVLETRAFLYGFHFDSPGVTQTSAAAFGGFIAERGGSVANGVRLYGCASWKARYGDGGNRSTWKAEMQRIANTLGYHGTVSGFNTGIIDPKDGTYVEYVPEYPQERCRIFYKRNEKMDYTNARLRAMPTANIKSFKVTRAGNMEAATGSVVYTSGANIQVTQSNKGALHELNYSLRLVSFEV